jgi:hypothetical protein
MLMRCRNTRKSRCREALTTQRERDTDADKKAIILGNVYRNMSRERKKEIPTERSPRQQLIPVVEENIYAERQNRKAFDVQGL